MSVQALSYVLEHCEARLGDRLVMIAVANHADDHGSRAYPSVPTLAREARMSERQVRRSLRRLERAGELGTQGQGGPHGTNVYCIAGFDDAVEKAEMSAGHIVPRANQVATPDKSDCIRSDLSPEPSMNRQEKQPSLSRGFGVGAATPKTGAAAIAMQARFDKFWQAYPRHVGKTPASRAFAKLKPSDADLDVMLKAIAAQRVTSQWTKDGGHFIPHPATWLNQHRWTDEVAPGGEGGGFLNGVQVL
ncbi:MAG TPA: helix-turn-helix domain-containing protein [Rhodanobacteraceae bacterium]